MHPGQQCLRVVNQKGGTKLPAGDPGWGVETSLDVQAVSTPARSADILLVQANSSSLTDMGKAVNEAVKLGADVVSNSYGTDEFTGVKTMGNRYYRHPGTAIVASTGDFGFTAAQFPAVLSTTIAVGGTTLKHAGNSGPSPPGPVPAAGARPGSPSRPGSTTPTARCGPPVTSRRTPTRTPGWRSTTPTVWGPTTAGA